MMSFYFFTQMWKDGCEGQRHLLKNFIENEHSLQTLFAVFGVTIQPIEKVIFLNLIFIAQ